MTIPRPTHRVLSEHQRGRLAAWVQHDYQMRYFDRKHAFHSLLRLGYDARQAVEFIQTCEREP